jgi:chemotaxis-related protein WspD
VSEINLQTLAPARNGKQHACWNEIGVYGAKSCPELKSFVHCRNCPVYSAAGVNLLKQTLPASYREERTAQYAFQKPSREQSRGSVIIFRIGGEWLALPTWMLQEVAECRPIHSLPHRRGGVVLGLASIRGELMLCISLARLLGLTEDGHDQARRLLVLNWQQISGALPVHEVLGLQRIQPDSLKAPPATLAQAKPAFTRNVFYWGNRVVGLLDPERVLSALNGNLA